MTEVPSDQPRRDRVDPEDIRKALEQQAKNRPPRGPAKPMPVTPPLPKVHKPRRRRRMP
jgi:hypothetical protein